MSLLALAMPHHIPAGQDAASCILRAPSPPRSLVHGEEGAGAADKPPQAMNQSCCLPRAKRLSPMAIYSCERAAARGQVSASLLHTQSSLIARAAGGQPERWPAVQESPHGAARRGSVPATTVGLPWEPAEHARGRDGITLAAFTSLQALSKPKPCWWLWLKPAWLVSHLA